MDAGESCRRGLALHCCINASDLSFDRSCCSAFAPAGVGGTSLTGTHTNKDQGALGQRRFCFLRHKQQEGKACLLIACAPSQKVSCRVCSKLDLMAQSTQLRKAAASLHRLPASCCELLTCGLLICSSAVYRFMS